MSAIDMSERFIPLDHYRPADRQKPKPGMIDEIEWFDEIEPCLTSNYLIKGVLDRGAMSVLYGPSNSGKTFFALDLAFEAARSGTWRGKRTNGGTVLYLAAEGGKGIANRIAALRGEHGSERIPLAVRRAGLDFRNPNADVQRVIDLAHEIAPDGLALIVVDTLSRAIAGSDENSASDMTAFIANVDRIRRETGAHVMIVHHSGKDTAKGARGHSSLRAATDTEIEISVDTDGNRAATIQKQRDHVSGECYSFDLGNVDLGVDQDGDTVRTCIVRPVDEPGQSGTKRRDSLSDQQALALRALHETIADYGETLPAHFGLPAGIRGVPVDKWRTTCNHCRITEGGNPDSVRKALYRVTRTLQRKGKIAVREGYVWPL